MFSLIITIISIALVAALAIATIYYGGTAFNKSSATADAIKLNNQAQQILSAMVLYQTDKGTLPTQSQLTTPDANGITYLKSWPVASMLGVTLQDYSAFAMTGTWSIVPGELAVKFTSDMPLAVCENVNKSNNGPASVLTQLSAAYRAQCIDNGAGNYMAVYANNPSIPVLLKAVSNDASKVVDAPIPESVITVNSANLDAGTYDLSSPSMRQVTLNVTSSQSTAQGVYVDVSSLTGSAFSVNSALSTCAVSPGTAISLPAGSSCDLVVNFAPTISLGAESKSITVHKTGAGSPIPVTVSGYSAQGFLVTSPVFINFGFILVGETVTMPVTITNTPSVPGPYPVTISHITVDAPFTLVSNNCNGVTLPVGGSCTISVSASPTEVGAVFGKLARIYPVGGGTRTASMAYVSDTEE